MFIRVSIGLIRLTKERRCVSISATMPKSVTPVIDRRLTRAESEGYVKESSRLGDKKTEASFGGDEFRYDGANDTQGYRDLEAGKYEWNGAR